MELRNLELFVHLAHSLHFARTADAMAVSPSTLSRAIQRLEQETGCTLFERDNRSVSLTPAGQRLREFAEQLMADWAKLLQDLRHSHEPLQGRLKVFCSRITSYNVCYTKLLRGLICQVLQDVMLKKWAAG